MQNKDLIIVGAGGHARVVVDTAQQCGYNVVGIIDPKQKEEHETILGIPVIGGLHLLDKFPADNTSIFIAIGDNQRRKDYFDKIKATDFGVPSLIHPTACLSPHMGIGEGTLINAGTILNAGVHIGSGVIVNTGAILDHEVEVGDFVHIGPGVSIGGRSQVDKLSFVGLGTSVIDYISIGDHVTIGAGSTIIKDIASNTKVVGVSKIINK